MSIWSKVFAVCLFLALLGLFHAAARLLKTQDAFRSNVVAHEREIEYLERQVEIVRDHQEDESLQPVEGSPSISQLEVSLHEYLTDRGRVWYNVTPQAPAPDTGIVTVETSRPVPHMIEQGAVLFVCDQLEIAEGGRYLGEFKVTALNGERGLTLEPTEPLSERRRRNLTASAGPWVLYEVMPADSRAAFAGLTDDQLRALLPKPPEREQGEDDAAFDARRKAHEAFVREYLKDGKPPELGDPDERVRVIVRFTKQDEAARQLLATFQPPIPEGVLTTNETYEFNLDIAKRLTDAGIAEEVSREYRRTLWDFVQLAREFSRQQPILLDQIATATKDVAEMTAANRDGEAQILFHEAEVARLKGEVQRLKDETALADARRQRLEGQLQTVQDAIAAGLSRNKELAQRLATLQQQAAERAEEALDATQASAED